MLPKLESCTARKVDAEQSVTPGRESTGKSGPYPGEPQLRDIPWEAPTKRRRARAGISGSCKGGTSVQKKITRDL